MERANIHTRTNASIHVGVEWRGGPGHVLELVDGQCDDHPLMDGGV